MTRVTVSIEVAESVDPADFGTWLEGWIRDQWDGHGEPAPDWLVVTCSNCRAACVGGRCPRQESADCADGTIHLESVKAQPPASGRTFPECPGCAVAFKAGEVAPVHTGRAWHPECLALHNVQTHV